MINVYYQLNSTGTDNTRLIMQLQNVLGFLQD